MTSPTPPSVLQDTSRPIEASSLQPCKCQTQDHLQHPQTQSSSSSLADGCSSRPASDHVEDLTAPKQQPITMAQTYACTSPSCPQFETFYPLDEMIEHIRKKHISSIRRPNALGISDSHGNVWYCFACEGSLGQDHRSFNSDQAMWAHLNDKHDLEVVSWDKWMPRDLDG